VNEGVAKSAKTVKQLANNAKRAARRAVIVFMIVPLKMRDKFEICHINRPFSLAASEPMKMGNSFVLHNVQSLQGSSKTRLPCKINLGRAFGSGGERVKQNLSDFSM